MIHRHGAVIAVFAAVITAGVLGAVAKSRQPMGTGGHHPEPRGATRTYKGYGVPATR